MKKYLLLLVGLVAVFCFAGQAHAAITSGSGVPFSGSSAGTVTATVNVASTPNPVLFVSLGHEFGTISAVTYNGVALTQLWDQVDGANVEHSSAWILVNPPTGSNTLSVTWSGGDALGGYAQPWYGVAQGGGQGTTWRTPVFGNDGGNGSATASAAVSNAASGDTVLDVLADYAQTPTVNGSQTLQNQQNGVADNGLYFGTSNELATGATTMQWTMNSTYWTEGAVALIPATGAGVDNTPPSTPTNLSASAVSPSQINLSWSPSTDNVGVTGYDIYRGGTQIATTAGTSFSDFNVSASTAYTYTVSAFDLAGNTSAQSVSANATTPAPVQAPPPSQNGSGQLWSGILSGSRATNWSGAGVIGGIPDANWPQCGPTIAAYSGTAAVISAALNHTGAGYTGCTAPYYIQLGAGTFNLTTGISFGSTGHVALRGAGANQTFIVLSSAAFNDCDGLNTGICMQGLNAGYWVQDAAVNWTAGYAPGTSVITLASVAGIIPNQTLVGLDQCAAGDSGTPCTNAPGTDNGGYFDCDIIYTTGSPATGCAVNGPDGGNQRLNRPQNEIFQVLAVNAATNQVTLNGSLRAPNWNAANSPQAFIIQPIQDTGVENLSLDSTNDTSLLGSIICVYYMNCWVTGVRLVNPGYAGVYFFVGAHGEADSNYVYGDNRAPGADSDAFNSTATSDNLYQNNITQMTEVSVLNEGADTGSVYGYNYFVDQYDDNDGIYPGIFPHAGDRFQLFEGNVFNSFYAENYHGPKLMDTLYRNLITGWESCANGQCGGSTSKNSATTPIRLVAYSRYQNAVGNVLGTPGYQTSYSTTNAFSTANIYELGSGNGSIPVDPITAQTFLRWGNYDVVTGQTQWNPAEVPSSLSQFANPVPTTESLPASFYLSSRPSWWPMNMAWPAIGPDVNGGNVGVCSGTLNTPGQFSGVASLSTADCKGTSLTSAWAGHVSATPAMNCYLNVMGGTPDGSGGGPLSFNAATCYGASSGSGGGTPPPSDTTPPTTSITSPSSGATISGSAVSVSASASDNVGVTKVEFYVDGVLQSTDTSAPYSFSLNTTSLTNASHVLSTKAYDAAGNVGSSANVSVTVNNVAQTLTASLSASTISGTAPLQISLTATAGGTAQGTLNYIFYCNRTDTGTNVTSPADLTISAIASTTYVASNVCTYQSAGTYTAKVIIERGSAPVAQAQKTITVSAAPVSGGGTPTSTPTSTPPNPSSPVSILSAVVSQVTDTTAVVTVSTNQSASIQVKYGITTAYGQTTQASPALTTTFVNLTGLTQNTVYDFIVMATGQNTTTAVTSQNFIFTTEITPAPSGGGGSTGGGGGGSAPTPTPAPVSSGGGGGGGPITPIPTPSPAPVTPSGGTSSGSSATGSSGSTSVSAPAFPRNLIVGDTGQDVLLLQEILKSLGYFSSTFVPTTYFGTLTQHALLLFQRDHQINRSGFLDLQSQTLMNKIAASEGIGGSVTTAPSASTTTTAPSTTSSSFPRNLSLGMSGPDVTLLQETLFKDGDYPQDIITGYFGSLTEQALQAFQAKYGIVSSGTPSTTGYGSAGPRTRAKLGGL